MRISLFALAGVSAFSIAGPAQAKSDEAVLAQCAWSKVSMTSAALLKVVKFDKLYEYDADGSPTVGPLMRVWAACHDEKAAIRKASGHSIDNRKFLKELRSTKPEAMQSDVFAIRVFRCQTRFVDEPASEPVAVGWGFGDDLKSTQLRYSSKVYGMTLSAADLAGIKNEDVDAMKAMLDRANKADVAKVDTRAEGEALKKPYAVKDGGGARTCQFVLPDGSYTDA